MFAIMSWTDGELGSFLLMKSSEYQFITFMITTAENFR